MHTRTWTTADYSTVVVNFNSDFSGMARVTWTGPDPQSPIVSREVPAVILTLAVQDAADTAWELFEDLDRLAKEWKPDATPE